MLSGMNRSGADPVLSLPMVFALQEQRIRQSRWVPVQRVPVPRETNPPPQTLAHGTAKGYKHKGCRCRRCKAAYATYNARWRTRQVTS